MSEESKHICGTDVGLGWGWVGLGLRFFKGAPNFFSEIFQKFKHLIYFFTGGLRF